MTELIPEGTIVVLDDGTSVRVGRYIEALSCYRVSYDGPGYLASARMLEAVWRRHADVSQGDRP